MRLSSLLALPFVLLFSTLAAAEPPTGRVVDPQRGGVVGADVKLSGALLAAQRTARTDDEGRYAFDTVTPGRYTFRVDSPGFVALVREVTVGTGGLAERGTGRAARA